jgi:hypothetical protein
MTQARLDRARHLSALGALAAVALVAAACDSGSAPSALASALSNASLPPIATEAPTATPATSEGTATTEPSESAGPSAVATDIDPCQLITAADASTLAGVTFGAGKAHTTENNVKSCVYAAGTTVFTVEVAVAPDEATAKAAEAGAEKDLEDQGSKMSNAGVKVTKLPGFAPNTDAALMEASVTAPIQFDARAMFLLKNTIFAGFSDIALNGTAPSADAMKAQAMTVISKLP